MNRIVIDASVVLKWYLSDEKHGYTALQILDKYVSYEIEILAPSLLEYEVLNGLFIARKRGRIQEEMVVTAVEGFLSLEIQQKDISFFYPEVLHFSESYNLSIYDASYLAVANEEGALLVTADKNLYNKVKTDLKWVKWIGDFSF
ncbi:MAG: type II toxin-antitoxin system VapC family toxin [Candidatus Aminicenantes bacterium]|nr:type II toxin-antitoxin system VapC family toxin [Candidatus Aminicenantes bacterium]